MALRDQNGGPVAAYREQTVEIALGPKGAFENGNVGALTRRASSARPPWTTLHLFHESCSWTIAVVLPHRKMTLERAEPISTIWRMFIFLANAKTTAIPNKTLPGSQGTATPNRIVM